MTHFRALWPHREYEIPVAKWLTAGQDGQGRRYTKLMTGGPNKKKPIQFKLSGMSIKCYLFVCVAIPFPSSHAHWRTSAIETDADLEIAAFRYS